MSGPRDATVIGRGGRALILLAAIVSATITARLGVWQLDRAAQKQALQAQIEQRRAMPALPQAELASTEVAAAAQHHRRITLRGQWLHAHTTYLDNRQMNARPGFFVMTPLLLGPGDAVLVQRGWMPRDAQDRSRLQALPEQTGEVLVSGRIAAAPSKLIELGPSAPGRIRQNLDLAELSAEIKLPLRPLSLQQLEPTSGPALAADNLLRQWLDPTLGTAKHHGYAFQWFALSALIVGLYAWFQLNPYRRRPSA